MNRRPFVRALAATIAAAILATGAAQVQLT